VLAHAALPGALQGDEYDVVFDGDLVGAYGFAGRTVANPTGADVEDRAVPWAFEQAAGA
jgi:hypothetical protein